MIPGQFHFNTESSRKAQNYPFASKTPKQSMLTKLDLDWSRRLDKLLNNADDQDDYYQIYSGASDTTISTICVNSDASRYTDSCWSDTDATRSDDTVRELSESAFFNIKVNPFPQLNFPPTSSFQKNVSNIVEDNQNTDNVAPADATNEIMIDVRNNEDSAPAVEVVNGDDREIEHMVSRDVDTPAKIKVPSRGDIARDDSRANGVADVESNKELDSEDGFEIESNVTDAQHIIELSTPIEITNKIIDNQTTEDNVALACGVGNHLLDDQKTEDLATAEVATAMSKIDDDHNSKEDLIPENDVKKYHSVLAPPTEGVTHGMEDRQNNGNLAAGKSIEDLTGGVTDDVKDNSSHQGKAPPIADVTHGVKDQQNSDVNEIDDQIRNQSSFPNINATESRVISMENVSSQKVIVTDVATRSGNESPKSNRNASKTAAEVKGTASEPNPVASTSTKHNSTLEPRKKRYRKTVDNSHRKNVEHQLSKSSGCTKVTSTTTVEVTTNDDVIFDALADMPDFINSSVVDIASSYIDDRVRLRKNQLTRCIDFDSAVPSSSSSLAPSSWRNEKLSSVYDEYISSREAYKQLNSLLRDGTNENLKAVMYDEYNGLRFDDDIASSEDEFLSDIDDLNVTTANWKPVESELRRQVAIILNKIHPLEDNYCGIIDDMLSKYLNYIHSKQRLAKINRIVDCVNQPISQQEKTELLIRREFDDKKLNREFYHSSMEPSDFTELGERRRQAIIKKYTRCHNDRKFCYSYFKRSIDDRPISKLGWRIAKLKQELELIFA